MKVLACDGGGVRGAVTISFLKHLEDYLQRKEGKSIHEYFELFVGTSTGGLIALCLASGMPAREVALLYSKENTDIILTKSSTIDVYGSKYTDAKRGVFTKVMDKLGITSRPLSAALKPCAVTAYNLTDRTAQVLSSVRTDWTVSDISFIDAADSTSAAPTYFPSVKVRSSGGEKYFIDGGVVCNQPSMTAVALAQIIDKRTRLDDIKLLSVGTAVDRRPIKGTGFQGTAAWLPYLLNVLTDTSITDFYTLSLLEKNFLRVNTPTTFSFNGVTVSVSPALDDGSEKNIKNLSDLGNLWWLAFERKINDFFSQ